MTKGRLAKEIVLWLIILLLVLVCFRSGWLKVTGSPFWIRDFHRWGYPDWFRIVIGITELTSALLLLVPRVAAYGACLFAVVMLGAIFTHATHHESVRIPFNLLLLALCSIIAYARRPAFLIRAQKSETADH